MRHVLPVALALIALTGCLGVGATWFHWEVKVEPFEGRWFVALPVPTGAASAEDLVESLRAAAAAERTTGQGIDVLLGEVPDGRRFVQLGGRPVADLAMRVRADADVEIVWEPRGVENLSARLESGGQVRVTDTWTVERGGRCLRGESWSAILTEGETMPLKRLRDPCLR